MQEEAENGCEGSTEMGRIGYRPYWVLSLSILIMAIHQVGAAIFLIASLDSHAPKKVRHRLLF